MKPFIKKFDSSYVDIYPIGDLHWGSQNCDTDFVQKVIDEVADNPEGRVVLMGDLCENALTNSKSDVYKQIMSPQKQVEEIAEVFMPIKDKILFAITGNHEERTFKTSGNDLTDNITMRLCVPYKGYSCLAKFFVNSKTPNGFLCYFHHSWGGGYTHGGKVNASDKLRTIVPHADAIFNGHSHTTGRIPHTWYDLGKAEVLEKTGYNYITGSALTYSESYGEARGARPASCEFIKVRLKGASTGKRDNRQQVYSVITK